MHVTLIDVVTLFAALDHPDWVVVDCRFSLADTEAGRRAYEAAHIPGAIYAHLDDDLSNPPTTDNGRHPLPPVAIMNERLGQMGIDNSKQVVVYDDANGATAARLWWMLRYLGHEAVAVLDGGWKAWLTADLPRQAGVQTKVPALFHGEPRTEWLVTMSQVPAQPLLVDSREAPRYRGEFEPIDPQAGHIPGAVNYFFQRNWGEDGRYLPPAQLREQLTALFGSTSPDEVTFYCGSGVTACVNLLAMAHAGLGNGRLYVGSWGEWCRQAENPVGRHL
ncbi:MAG: sulfurtransferase [Ardenticatenaceae bacterium]|nr:sulfurtransferase [Ardenticatenaceae bacterium]